jgi:hypothetical protein
MPSSLRPLTLQELKEIVGTSQKVWCAIDGEWREVRIIKHSQISDIIQRDNIFSFVAVKGDQSLQVPRLGRAGDFCVEFT